MNRKQLNNDHYKSKTFGHLTDIKYNDHCEIGNSWTFNILTIMSLKQSNI